jgi:hypothetical protein
VPFGSPGRWMANASSSPRHKKDFKHCIVFWPASFAKPFFRRPTLLFGRGRRGVAGTRDRVGLV